MFLESPIMACTARGYACSAYAVWAYTVEVLLAMANPPSPRRVMEWVLGEHAAYSDLQSLKTHHAPHPLPTAARTMQVHTTQTTYPAGRPNMPHIHF